MASRALRRVDSSDPIRAQIRLKNNQLLLAREALGLTQEKMAKFVGASPHVYAAHENLRLSPVRNGNWTRVALRIAQVLEAAPEELFPYATQAVTIPSAEVSMSPQQIERLLEGKASPIALPEPEARIVESDLRRATQQAVGTLMNREQEVLEARFGMGAVRNDEGKTLTETGNEMSPIDELAQAGISPERVRQIEAKALRKLRHPSRAHLLRIFVDADRFVEDEGKIRQTEEVRQETADLVRQATTAKTIEPLVELALVKCQHDDAHNRIDVFTPLAKEPAARVYSCVLADWARQTEHIDLAHRLCILRVDFDEWRRGRDS